jgi:hypothetical protein
MARPSIESLSVATVSIPVRPEPPEDLTEYQKKIWNDVTSTKPPEWFESDSFPILRAYCVAAERHLEIGKAMQGLKIQEREYQNLIKVEETQAKLIAALAVKMRLTQQSRYTPRSSVTANKKASAGKKPWEK